MKLKLKNKSNYQLDQSGKIEDTTKNTIIALSNGKHISIKIDRKSKRQIQLFYRQQGKPTQYVYQTFAAIVAIAIHIHSECSSLTIDTEYFGHDNLIKIKTIFYLKNLGYTKPIDIKFALIGKSSSAHLLASKVAHNKKPPTKNINANDILKIIFPKKRPGTLKESRTV